MNDTDVPPHTRLVCPIHHIPDCSALLNGCTILNWAYKAVAVAYRSGRAEAFDEASNYVDNAGDYGEGGWYPSSFGIITSNLDDMAAYERKQLEAL